MAAKNMTGLGPAESKRRLAPPGGVCDFYRARTGRRIRYCLWPSRRAKPRGTVVLIAGRAEFVEKHFETIADLLQRGFAVLAFDWRNQGLSGRPLGDVQRHHLKDFNQLADDLADLLAQPFVRRCPRPLFALAHSMGAFAFLKFLERYPKAEKIFAGAVLCAPMLGLRFSPFPYYLGRFLIQRGIEKGKAEQFAPLQGPYGKRNQSEEVRKRLTSDPARFADEAWQVARKPALAVGGVTYGWVDAALKGLKQLFSSNLPERMTLPVLFILAGRDQVVDNRKTQAFIKRIKSAHVVTLADARHEIWKERDELRNTFLKLFDSFAAAH
jgi:lysophospholipase